MGSVFFQFLNCLLLCLGKFFIFFVFMKQWIGRNPCKGTKSVDPHTDGKNRLVRHCFFKRQLEVKEHRSALPEPKHKHQQPLKDSAAVNQ